MRGETGRFRWKERGWLRQLKKRRKKGFKEIQRQDRKSVFIGTGATDKRQHLHKKEKRNEIDCHQVIVSRKVCTIKLNEDLVWQFINGYIIAQCRHFRIKSYQPEGGIFYSFLAHIFISFHPFTRTAMYCMVIILIGIVYQEDNTEPLLPYPWKKKTEKKNEKML